MEKFNLENLRGLEGAKVTLASEYASQQATIKGVQEFKANGAQWEAFTLTLEVPKNDELALYQGTYKISHEQFGELALFASPNTDTELEFVMTRKLNHAV